MDPACKAYVKSNLTCSICRSIFYRPIVLLCQHTFCKDCLKKTKTRHCPTCRLIFVIPKEYNREIDAICEKLSPKSYQKHKLEVTKEELQKTLSEKLYDEVYNEVHNKTVTGALEEYKSMGIAMPILSQAFSPETVKEVDYALEIIRKIGPVILLNFLAIVFNFTSWSGMNTYSSYVFPIALFIDFGIMVIFGLIFSLGRVMRAHATRPKCKFIDMSNDIQEIFGVNRPMGWPRPPPMNGPIQNVFVQTDMPENTIFRAQTPGLEEMPLEDFYA